MPGELAQALKLGMRRLVSGVSVIAAQLPSGERQAMTVSSLTSVSADPPSLLVCVNRETRMSPWLQPGLAMAVNVLQTHHQGIAQVCADPQGFDQRFSDAAWRFDGQAPYLVDAQACFFVVVDTLVPYGTHDIVVARITQVQVADQAFSPLLYADGQYREIAPLP